jgi:hypothetical protein
MKESTVRNASIGVAGALNASSPAAAASRAERRKKAAKRSSSAGAKSVPAGTLSSTQNKVPRCNDKATWPGWASTSEIDKGVRATAAAASEAELADSLRVGSGCSCCCAVAEDEEDAEDSARGLGDNSGLDGARMGLEGGDALSARAISAPAPRNV